MRLLERDVPLQLLQRIPAETATAGGRLAFLEGEAGIGAERLSIDARVGQPATLD